MTTSREDEYRAALEEARRGLLDARYLGVAYKAVKAALETPASYWKERP